MIDEFLKTCVRGDAVVSPVAALFDAYVETGGRLSREEFDHALSVARLPNIYDGKLTEPIRIAQFRERGEPMALQIAPPDFFWYSRGGWAQMIRSDGT